MLHLHIYTVTPNLVFFLLLWVLRFHFGDVGRFCPSWSCLVQCKTLKLESSLRKSWYPWSLFLPSALGCHVTICRRLCGRLGCRAFGNGRGIFPQTLSHFSLRYALPGRHGCTRSIAFFIVGFSGVLLLSSKGRPVLYQVVWGACFSLLAQFSCGWLGLAGVQIWLVHVQTRADCWNLNHLDSPDGDHEAEAGAWSLRLGMQRQVTEHSLAFSGLPVPKGEQLGLMFFSLTSTRLFLEGKQKDVCES